MHIQRCAFSIFELPESRGADGAILLSTVLRGKGPAAECGIGV